MILHGVNLLCRAVKLDGLGTLVIDSGAGLLVLVRMLRRALLGIFIKEFSLFQRVPGAMQHACIFRTGQRINWMSCIVSLALVSTALLGVGWQGGCS